jgi:DNA-directed RNA polymerase specialized sigma24 family protein
MQGSSKREATCQQGVSREFPSRIMIAANHIANLVDHLFRHESGKMVSILSRLLGLQNIETAQDIVQDTLLQAMNTWGFGGVPENPPAWLHRVARNKAIDYLRRENGSGRSARNIRDCSSLNTVCQLLSPSCSWKMRFRIAS